MKHCLFKLKLIQHKLIKAGMYKMNVRLLMLSLITYQLNSFHVFYLKGLVEIIYIGQEDNMI